MKKSNTYFLILAIALIIIAVGYLLNIPFIKSVCAATLNHAQKQTLSVSAAVCAFLFYGSKNYWLAIIISGLAASLVVKFLIIGGSAGVFTIATMMLAFIAIVYFMNLVKIIINKYV